MTDLRHPQTDSRCPHFFIAVPLPNKVKSVLAEWSETLRKHWQFGKWVHPSDYHITLRFLGSCPTEKVEQVKEHLSRSLPPAKPFTLNIGGLHIFGQPQRPRILWADVGGEKDALQRLQHHVSISLETIGFPREQRPYRPHITLAKRYQKNDFPYKRLAMYNLPETKPIDWPVREMVLYQTHLGKIPMYESVRKYALQSGQSGIL